MIKYNPVAGVRKQVLGIILPKIKMKFFCDELSYR